MRIEISPSGRAACRGCKKPIAKGELRFGESYVVPATGVEGTRYWHLLCAAQKVAGPLKTAMDAYPETIPDRAAIDAAMAKPSGKSADAALPHVDRAPTGRAKCMVCDEAIEKGSYRVAVEREVDTGTFVTKGPGYLHPKCAPAWAKENLGDESELPAWKESLFANSGLAPAEAAEVAGLLTA